MKTNSGDFAAQPSYLDCQYEERRASRPAGRPCVRHLQEHYVAPTSGVGAGRDVLRPVLRRVTVARPVGLKPVPLKDRQYLRALREAEMSLWVEIQKTAGEQCVPQPKPSVGQLFTNLTTGHQKRELAMLLILAAAAAVAVTVSFIETGSFLQRWAEFVTNVRNF